MCVAITLEPGTKLEVDEIERMNNANADGVGIAWAYNGQVHWAKTLKVNPEQVHDIIDWWSNFPRLVHFRLATAGGTKTELCHPFDISAESICTPVGSSQRVMIHNGHWSRWQEVLKLLGDEGLLPDKGPWSDSRLAAWLAHEDMDWLQALGGRVAVMNADETVTRTGDWVELRSGVWVSNKHWEYRQPKRGGYAGYNGQRGWKGWEWSEEDWAELERMEQEEENKTKQTTLTSLVSDKPPEKTDKGANGAKKEKARASRREDKIRHYSEGHWQDPTSKRWFKYSTEAGALVEVTSEHTEGQEASGGDGVTSAAKGKNPGEFAP